MIIDKIVKSVDDTTKLLIHDNPISSYDNLRNMSHQLSFLCRLSETSSILPNIIILRRGGGGMLKCFPNTKCTVNQ